MAWTTRFKDGLNQGLRPLHLRLETLTAELRETDRLQGVRRRGQFEGAVFPVPPAFRESDPAPLLEEVHRHAERLRTLRDAGDNDVGYTYDNPFYSSPDAEILYAMVRHLRPATFLEVGSGNSTRIARQAILDGRLETRLISIDPAPRKPVEAFADEVYRRPVEEGTGEIFGRLRSGDVLFIDSSHELRTGNDVIYLYLEVLPSLPAGVVIHIHDVFLPYEYPQEWVIENRWGWNEQYLVQAILTFGEAFEVLWAGYWLQRTREDFTVTFPDSVGRRAASLWLRRRLGAVPGTAS